MLVREKMRSLSGKSANSNPAEVATVLDDPPPVDIGTLVEGFSRIVPSTNGAKPVKYNSQSVSYHIIVKHILTRYSIFIHLPHSIA